MLGPQVLEKVRQEAQPETQAGDSKAVANVLPGHIVLYPRFEHTKEVLVHFYIIQFKSPSPKRQESLSWNLMNKSDRSLCTALERIVVEGVEDVPTNLLLLIQYQCMFQNTTPVGLV